MNVPFLDLKAQYLNLRSEIDAAIQSVIDKTAFAGGPFVTSFEEAFAAYCGSRHAVGLGSGTDALWLAMLALGIGPGDEVVTSVNTFIATAEAISFTGAKPVFVDVDPRTYTMDPAALEAAVTPRTKAVAPVHMFGQPADMDPIMAVAKRHGLLVIEDACQAHGADYKGRRAGTIGDVGCFSFYPGKNLGAYGEAGAIVTNDEALAKAVKRLRDHGQDQKYHHGCIGWNGRMDGIQGAILEVKLKHLDEANEARRAHAADYTARLSGDDRVLAPFEAAYAHHVYHVYALRVPQRDAMLAAMKDCGVACAIHYPVPLHLQKAYSGHAQAGLRFPVAEQCANEYLSLPMFPELTTEQVAHVADSLLACLDQAGT